MRTCIAKTERRVVRQKPLSVCYYGSKFVDQRVKAESVCNSNVRNGQEGVLNRIASDTKLEQFVDHPAFMVELTCIRAKAGRGGGSV